MTGSRGILDVRLLIITDRAIDPALLALQEAGAHQNEAFALLGGILYEDQQSFEFTSCYIPDQTSFQTEDGLHVEVPGSALHRANLEFHHRGELMAGQVHSHPTDAFHSSLDDALPLVTLLGALSIVVPDFAADGISSIHRWAFYRLIGVREWRLTREDEVEYRI